MKPEHVGFLLVLCLIQVHLAGMDTIGRTDWVRLEGCVHGVGVVKSCRLNGFGRRKDVCLDPSMYIRGFVDVANQTKTDVKIMLDPGLQVGRQIKPD